MKKLAAYIFKFGHDNSKNLQNFNMDEFFGQNWFDISFWFMQGMLFGFSSISHDLETAKLLSKCPFNNAKNYVPINPLTAEWALRAPIDFTLSNARRFYSSMGNPLDGKGLKEIRCFLCFRLPVNFGFIGYLIIDHYWIVWSVSVRDPVRLI